MTLDIVKSYLTKAEGELNEYIANCLSSNNQSAPNYDEIEKCLAISRHIESIKSEFAGLTVQKKELDSSSYRQIPTAMSISYKLSKSVSSEFPMYFISGQKLYKIGQKSNPSDGLYKKSVPISDVEQICSCIAKMLEKGSFAIKELTSLFYGDLQPYKIQITTMALVNVEVLMDDGRGKYKLHPNATISPSDWIRRLEKLAERRDLLI